MNSPTHKKSTEPDMLYMFSDVFLNDERESVVNFALALFYQYFRFHTSLLLLDCIYKAAINIINELTFNLQSFAH